MSFLNCWKSAGVIGCPRSPVTFSMIWPRDLIKSTSTLWKSGGKITGSEIEDDITDVVPDANDFTLKTAVFIGVEKNVGTAVVEAFTTGVEVSVGNAVEGVVAKGEELKVGITVAAFVKSTAGVGVFLCTAIMWY